MVAFARTLSTDDLRTVAPSIFATQPWEDTASYRFIPTSDILSLMADQGFGVTMARQSRTRIPGKRDFTRHMLRLRHESFLDNHAGGELPEVVLMNSHDRSSAYKLFSGVFRLICQNGAIIQSADFGGFSIRHSGSRDLFTQVREATGRIMDGIPTIMGRIERWKDVTLPRREQVDFARQAMALKPNPSIPAEWLLTARREEDATNADASRDLWKSFNTIQENLMRGGLTGRNGRGRQISTRPVKAVDADLRINRRLWDLAESFSRI